VPPEISFQLSYLRKFVHLVDDRGIDRGLLKLTQTVGPASSFTPGEIYSRDGTRQEGSHRHSHCRSFRPRSLTVADIAAKLAHAGTPFQRS